MSRRPLLAALGLLASFVATPNSEAVAAPTSSERITTLELNPVKEAMEETIKQAGAACQGVIVELVDESPENPGQDGVRISSKNGTKLDTCTRQTINLEIHGKTFPAPLTAKLSNDAKTYPKNLSGESVSKHVRTETESGETSLTYYYVPAPENPIGNVNVH